ncbi:MAG: hypothetical protein J2P28_14255 [Actinobacteria bacterium]|nr:hypothetical protein [Actinomycetota bacterium]
MTFDPTAGIRAHNFEFVGYTDQGGMPGGTQVMVHEGHAYIGKNEGVSVIDVTDPRRPHQVNFLPGDVNSWHIHLQVHGDLLLVIDSVDFYMVKPNERDYYGKSIAGVRSSMFGERGKDFAAGMRVYDISNPADPRRIGHLDVEGCGLHRIWYDGGRYAYASALLDGYTDHILLIVDMADPARPVEAGRWWLPGMWYDGGEEPSWQKGRVALHHAVVAEGIAYGAWRDGGLTILDVHDPSRPELLVHRNWSPPFGGGTHSCLPLLDRDLLVVADEAVLDNCADQVKYTWVFDIRDKTNPISIATLPTPREEDYCSKPGHFGPHNLHENRQGTFQSSSLIYATYQNAGLRLFDIGDPFRPEELGYFVPPLPEKMTERRKGRPLATHTTDVFVDREGLAYLSDYNAGMYIVRYTGG